MNESRSRLLQNNKILIKALSKVTKCIKYEHENIETECWKARVWVRKESCWGDRDSQVVRGRMDFDRPCQGTVISTCRTVIWNFFVLAIHFQVQELLAMCLTELNSAIILQFSELGDYLIELFVSQAALLYCRKFWSLWC